LSPSRDDRKPTGPDLSVNPIFIKEPVEIPRDRLPPTEPDANVAYQIVHDELLLDGNPRLNLATIVTTWMEPEATPPTPAGPSVAPRPVPARPACSAGWPSSGVGSMPAAPPADPPIDPTS
jgi:hypothetical protein